MIATHFTVYFPYACLDAFYCLLSLRMHLCTCLTVLARLYAFHCLLALCMHLCITLSTFPVHAVCMHFTVYSPCAYICALASVMPLPISLSTFPTHASMHATVFFPCACIYAFHSVLALRMPLCMSLSTFPLHASIHFTVYFPYAVGLCRTQRLYRKNPSQCFREKAVRWPLAATAVRKKRGELHAKAIYIYIIR